ncbi:MAG: hypothetical protein Q8P17_03345 [bacterium]|nr:hypothetical protein [bacterium]
MKCEKHTTAWAVVCFAVVEYVCGQNTLSTFPQPRRNLMLTLLQSDIQAFLARNRPSKEWTTNLNEHLHGTENITTNVTLVCVVDESIEVFVLKANEVCNDKQVQRSSDAFLLTVSGPNGAI